MTIRPISEARSEATPAGCRADTTMCCPRAFFSASRPTCRSRIGSLRMTSPGSAPRPIPTSRRKSITWRRCVAGAGAEVAITANWIARLEYLYRNFGHADVTFPSGTTAGSSYDGHEIRAGLNYKLGSPAAYSADFAASQTQFPDWEIHGQITYIQQGYPAFHSPYLGANSFTPWPQTRNTWTA